MTQSRRHSSRETTSWYRNTTLVLQCTSNQHKSPDQRVCEERHPLVQFMRRRLRGRQQVSDGGDQNLRIIHRLKKVFITTEQLQGNVCLFVCLYLNDLLWSVGGEGLKIIHVADEEVEDV